MEFSAQRQITGLLWPRVKDKPVVLLSFLLARIRQSPRKQKQPWVGVCVCVGGGIDDRNSQCLGFLCLVILEANGVLVSSRVLSFCQSVLWSCFLTAVLQGPVSVGLDSVRVMRHERKGWLWTLYEMQSDKHLYGALRNWSTGGVIKVGMV